jgi:acetyl esterase/lipase
MYKSFSKYKIILLCVIGILVLNYNGHCQAVYPLYEGKIPNSRKHSVKETYEEQDGVVRIGNITVPTIEVFLPDSARNKGAAIIIFPGGGYWINAYKHEGVDVAKALNQWGIAAFVVKYRIPDSATMPNPAIGPIQDAQRALQWVRERADSMKLDINKIGMLGFSAGGHLVSTAGTHFNTPYIDNPQRISLRPDFMVLVYSVISYSAPYAHSGSSTKLLGSKPTQSMLDAFSAEKNVTDSTPPSFLVHTTEDNGVSPLHSIRFYEALLAHNVPAELHIYQFGKHGFGLQLPNKNESWLERCIHWMEGHGWISQTN